MTRQDDASGANPSPIWDWLEPLTFDDNGMCRDPVWLRGKSRAEIDALTWAEWADLRPTTANARFVVVPGDGVCDRPSAGNVEAHQCGACSDELRLPYDRLSKVRVGSFVCRGRLEGGSEWWACARCGTLYYRAG
jgi:hypothetical protein